MRARIWDSPRGARVIVTIGNEEHSITVEAARHWHAELARVLAEVPVELSRAENIPAGCGADSYVATPTSADKTPNVSDETRRNIPGPADPARDLLGTFLAAYDDYLDGKIAYRDLPTQIYRADRLHSEIRERYFADAITAERAVDLRWLVEVGEWRRRPWWDRLIARLLGGGP